MPLNAYFERARKALQLGSQAELGAKLNVSRRTAQRFAAQGVPPQWMKDLIALVYPVDAALAAEMAESMGHTLESLHVVAPPAPPAPEPLPPVLPSAPALAPPPPPPAPDGIVDAVVCAAAEAMEMMPRDVRPGLLAAFARARDIGITVEMVERVLRADLAAASPPPADAPKGRRAT